MVEHATRLYVADAIFRIDPQNVVHVFGKIHDHRNVAALTTQACSAAARKDRRSVLARQAHGRFHILHMSRHNDANRHLAIIGAIGGIERPRPFVETHFAIDMRFK